MNVIVGFVTNVTTVSCVQREIKPGLKLLRMETGSNLHMQTSFARKLNVQISIIIKIVIL